LIFFLFQCSRTQLIFDRNHSASVRGFDASFLFMYFYHLSLVLRLTKTAS